LLRAPFVKQDVGRDVEVDPKSRRPLRIRAAALSAEQVWIKYTIQIESDCCGATFLVQRHFNQCSQDSEGPVTATWKTKWGVRRVRRDTPTVEEALIAAESLAADPVQRAEIAATLMGVPVEEVRALAAKQAARTRGRASLVAGRTRAVVVEYKRPRIGHGPMSFASKR
jgi:hypothetical protein